MLNRLKITAYFRTPVLINHPPYLDGILLSVMLKKDNPDLYWNGKELNKNRNTEIPFIAKIDNVNACSFAKYKVEGIQICKWRKRFEIDKAEKYMNITKNVYLTMGKYKNYNMPIKIQNIPKMEWIIIGDKKKIEKYLFSIIGIGKKQSQGWGIIREWEIEETTQKGERHFPLINKTMKNGIYGGVSYCSYRPSYYYKDNFSLCVIRKF